MTNRTAALASISTADSEIQSIYNDNGNRTMITAQLAQAQATLAVADSIKDLADAVRGIKDEVKS